MNMPPAEHEYSLPKFDGSFNSILPVKFLIQPAKYDKLRRPTLAIVGLKVRVLQMAAALL
jgi:hypothetical protein